MDVMFKVLEQVIIMLLILGVGMIAYRTKLISKEGNKQLSTLLLMIVNPVLIFVAYDQKFDKQHLTGLFLSFGITIVGMIVMIVLSHFLVKDKSKAYRVERFAATYSNTGFIGIPIVNGVFGAEGVFYLTGVITVFNIIVWTHGIILMGGKDGEKPSIKETAKNLMSPALIAAFLGLIVYLAQIPIPSMIKECLGYISDMNTPLAMLIAGLTLAQADLKKVFFNKRIYYVCFLKLIVYPMILLLLFRWLPIDPVIILSIIISLGGPVAATCTAFALRFDHHPIFASELFAVSTIFSAVSLPLIMLFNVFLETVFRW